MNEDALRKLREEAVKPFLPKDPGPEETLVNRVVDIRGKVRSLLEPVVKEAGYIRDPDAFTGLAAKLYRDEFHAFSRDELIYLLSTHYALATTEWMRP